MKRKLHAEAVQPAVQQPKEILPAVKKQLRSKLPRRKRSHISPILRSFSIAASSHLTSEVSRQSSKGSVNKEVKKREIEGEEFRRITRAYFRKNLLVDQKKDAEVELSECSCVDSCSEVIGRIIKIEDPVDISRDIVSKRNRNAKVIEGTEDSEAISRFLKASGGFCGESSKSGVDAVEGSRNAAKINHDDGVSFNSVLQSPSESKCGNLSVQSIKCSENRAAEEVESEVSRVCPEVELSAVEQAHEKLVEAEFDLECSENFSIVDVSDDYSSAYSELQPEIFPESSDIDLSDYSPSYWYDSGSQFSEKSNADASPSPTFTLFLRFGQQFCRSTAALQSTPINSSEDHISTEFTGLEDEEDEESYRMIRNRERRQLYLHDYAEEYCSTTDYGDLIVQQRLQMVHWILEQATRKDLQKETMFLSVNLFDRFLSKGIRQKTFSVAGTAYSCSEVVAMEWLVQEVLNFQCFLPTIYNFLWFYLKAATATEYMERTAKYLAVLALLGHEHLCYRPSTVASALVILALSAANLYASCHLVTKTHAKIKDEDLPECIKVLYPYLAIFSSSCFSAEKQAESEFCIIKVVILVNEVTAFS
ncbi:hypothetical protein RDI58_009838 [Solanum bulbocastanum]|uniref:Cyclin C-terminal domain-containing protein n=1 Tax=Solanum bulbocastanum TaxID=147425 RepID=A0AAN8TSV7_SOLBU